MNVKFLFAFTFLSAVFLASFNVGHILDADDLKKINDTYGHLMGDGAIAQVGRILRHSLTEERMTFRYAGDEFVVISVLRVQESNTVFHVKGASEAPFS